MKIRINTFEEYIVYVKATIRKKVGKKTKYEEKVSNLMMKAFHDGQKFERDKYINIEIGE